MDLFPSVPAFLSAGETLLAFTAVCGAVGLLMLGLSGCLLAWRLGERERNRVTLRRVTQVRVCRPTVLAPEAEIVPAAAEPCCEPVVESEYGDEEVVFETHSELDSPMTEDQIIRRWGFQIYERPASGPTRWKWTGGDGRIVPHVVALDHAWTWSELYLEQR